MTVERRFVVGLGDIRAVAFECKKCKVRVSYQPDASHLSVDEICPACGHKWWTSGRLPQGKRSDDVSDFLTGLQAIRKLARQESVGFLVLLEYDEPQA